MCVDIIFSSVWVAERPPFASSEDNHKSLDEFEFQ